MRTTIVTSALFSLLTVLSSIHLSSAAAASTTSILCDNADRGTSNGCIQRMRARYALRNRQPELPGDWPLQFSECFGDGTAPYAQVVFSAPNVVDVDNLSPACMAQIESYSSTDNASFGTAIVINSTAVQLLDPSYVIVKYLEALPKA